MRPWRPRLLSHQTPGCPAKTQNPFPCAIGLENGSWVSEAWPEMPGWHSSRSHPAYLRMADGVGVNPARLPRHHPGTLGQRTATPWSTCLGLTQEPHKELGCFSWYNLRYKHGFLTVDVTSRTQRSRSGFYHFAKHDGDPR